MIRFLLISLLLNSQLLAQNAGMFRRNDTLFFIRPEGDTVQINRMPKIWGQMEGTLSNQTDLQTALNGKQASGSYLVAADITGKANLISASLVTPNIGAAAGTSLSVTGAITSSGGGIGYITGNGGTVLQNTNKSTGVTLNELSGEITLNGAALAANTTVSFTFTNSTIATTDVIILNHSSAGTAGSYALNGQCGNGTAAINVRNITAGSLSQAIVIRFVIIKGSTN